MHTTAGATYTPLTRARRFSRWVIARFDLASQVTELIKIPRADEHFDTWHGVLIICVQPHNSALLNVRGVLRLGEGNSVVQHALLSSYTNPSAPEHITLRHSTDA